MSDLAIGIMSGTSGDGIDTAMVEVGDGDPPTFAVLAREHTGFTDGLRERILAAGAGATMTARDLARLHAALGDAYASAAERLITSGGRRPTVIGLHGQTIAHLPSEKATLQIGDAARVAVSTGVPVVDDFRSADVAAGGEGAPLTPFADHLLFAAHAPCVVLNLGGIANVTRLPDARTDSVTGSDTGPGNMVMDALARATGRAYDKDGEAARRGRVIEPALNEALRHPFFARRAPKSAGREEFGEPFARQLGDNVLRAGGTMDDAFATAAELTARTIADAIAGRRWDLVLVGGGGSSNPALMDALRQDLSPAAVRPTDTVGVPASAREAIAFAILAVYRMRGLPNTLPRVTGARHAVSAGAVHSP